MCSSETACECMCDSSQLGLAVDLYHEHCNICIYHIIIDHIIMYVYMGGR